MQDTKKVWNQHPAAGLGWSGALGSLCEGGEEEQGGSLLEASHAGKGAGTGKNKMQLG